MASRVALISTEVQRPGSTPAIHPRRSSSFTRAPGYEGPLPPGSPGDYANYIPSGDPMLPPVSTRYQPGMSTSGPTFSFDTGGAIQGGLQGAADCPPTVPWYICAAAGAVTGGTGGTGAGAGSGSSSSGALVAEGTGPCPSGYELGPDGQCKKAGFGGFVERALPGGSTGMLGDQYGPAVQTALGPALTPRQTGTVVRADGTTHPTLGCPAGMVLGKDNLCYDKRVIPKAARKWRPAPKPPMSAADAKALRRIGTLQRKVKKLAGNAGLSCRKR